MSTKLGTVHPSILLTAIEGAGWRLEHANYIWIQTEHNAALGAAASIRGLVEGRYVFRRK